MSNHRKQLHVDLTAKAAAAWQTFAREKGVTLTSLLEAGGRRLADPKVRAKPDNADMREVVKLARQIDAERRKR